MWGTIIIIVAVAAGALALALIVRRQAKGAAGCCDCPYGKSPRDCAPPARAEDAPAGCEKREE
jgi:hypothetical protein